MHQILSVFYNYIRKEKTEITLREELGKYEWMVQAETLTF